MKKIITTLAILTALSVATVANAMPNPTCPFDGIRGIWTGDVEVVDAKMYHVYKCVRGHLYLVKPY